MPPRKSSSRHQQLQTRVHNLQVALQHAVSTFTSAQKRCKQLHAFYEKTDQYYKDQEANYRQFLISTRSPKLIEGLTATMIAFYETRVQRQQHQLVHAQEILQHSVRNLDNAQTTVETTRNEVTQAFAAQNKSVPHIVSLIATPLQQQVLKYRVQVDFNDQHVQAASTSVVNEQINLHRYLAQQQAILEEIEREIQYKLNLPRPTSSRRVMLYAAQNAKLAAKQKLKRIQQRITSIRRQMKQPW